ncbi:hypothetical protein RYX36_030171 [Vicia faba]
MLQPSSGEKYPLFVSNTYNITKLYTNDDLIPIKDLLNGIPKDSLPIRTPQLGSQSQVWFQNSGISHQTPYKKFQDKIAVLPLKGIKELKTHIGIDVKKHVLLGVSD